MSRYCKCGIHADACGSCDTTPQDRPLPTQNTWFDVSVLIRRKDKKLAWQIRASFRIEEEAKEYLIKWRGITEAEILKTARPLATGPD